MRHGATVVFAAGFGSLFATYWDDAWHTDIGRDDALIAPHLLLYGTVALAGLVVAAWGLVAMWRARSVFALLRNSALTTAAAGGAVTLAAGVADAWWHAAFGRDAVLWSPPHMLAVFGSTTLIVGVLGESRLRTAGGALVLGSALISVLEFETGVPQFSETRYLPVLLLSALFATAVIRRLVPGRHPVARVVGVYVVARVLITVVLMVLGRSTPDLPLAIFGLAAADLPWRRNVTAYAAGAAGVSVTAVLSSALGLTGVPVSSLLPTAATVAVLFLLSPARLPRRAAAALILGAITLAPLQGADRAEAHDPGQGEPVAKVTLTGTSDGHGTLTLAAGLPGDCSACAIVARRAGSTLTGTVAVSGTRATGTVRVPPGGIWFVYLQTRNAETWLPLDSGSAGTVTQVRELYLPAGRAEGTGLPPLEVAAGILLYVAGFAVLALAIRQVRRPATV